MKFTRTLILLACSISLFSCSKSDSKDSQNPIIASDSSEYNGRLKVELRNQSNAVMNDAIVFLYASYPDLQNNISLNYVYTNSSGVADFGYLLQGNYYLLGRNVSGTLKSDPAVVQITSKREVFKTVIIK